MKKNVLSVLVTVLSASAMLAQEVKESKVDQSSGFNHWSVDLNSGFTKPTAPFAAGYYVNNFDFLHVDLGVRYMFNNKFGAKVDFGYDDFKAGDNILKGFETKYMRINLQGVVNVGRVLNFEDWTSRLGLQFHAGPGYSWMTSDVFSGKDQMLNILMGLTGQVRLTDRVALNADFTMINNIRQTYTFNGTTDPSVTNNRGFNGTIYDASLGLSIYLGKNAKHADWYISGAGLGSDDAKDKLAALQNKVDDLQNKLLDTDGDGVIDAIDEEKESAKGAIVDTKGRSTDLNNNGIADATDKVIAANKAETTAAIKSVTGTNSAPAATPAANAAAATAMGGAVAGEAAKKLINDGYVAAYFNLGDARPTGNSSEGIGFVLTYLRNNPSATIDIIGNTDETGTVEFNNKLANQRALNVKNILVKAGVASNRLNIVAKGEDKSVDVNSADARKLVRKVIFMIK